MENKTPECPSTLLWVRDSGPVVKKEGWILISVPSGKRLAHLLSLLESLGNPSECAGDQPGVSSQHACPRPADVRCGSG